MRRLYSKVDPTDIPAFEKAMEKNKAAVDEINKEIPNAKENIIISTEKRWIQTMPNQALPAARKKPRPLKSAVG